MVKDSVVLRMIKGDYGTVGLNMENTYKKTDLLLRLYRKVNWSISDRLDDLNEIAYESCLGDMESLSYLLNFAPERELDAFRSRAVNAMQSRVLIVTIEEIIGCQVHTYIAPKTIPKSPQGGGSEPATLDKTDTVITAEPELHPPFTEVAENNYLDVFDEF